MVTKNKMKKKKKERKEEEKHKKTKGRKRKSKKKSQASVVHNRLSAFYECQQESPNRQLFPVRPLNPSGHRKSNASPSIDLSVASDRTDFGILSRKTRHKPWKQDMIFRPFILVPSPPGACREVRELMHAG